MKKFLTGLSLIAALGFSSYGYGQEHDRTLREVAEELREDIHNNTTYIRDIDAHGVLDYWETPGETDEFDCEEGALKMAADLRNRGYNPEEARAVFGWIDVVTESSERGKYIVEEQGRDGHAWLETYELINIGDNIYYEQPTVHDWVFNISGTEEEIVRNHGIQ